MSDTLNTLVIYRLSDNRIIHSREQRYGLPLIADLSTAIFDSSSAIFDSSTMDYIVGVNSYDPEDFDDDGVLTDDAVTKYGVDVGEVAKYIQDLEIIVPEADRCDDLVFDEETGEIVETLQAVTVKPRYIKIAVSAVSGTSKKGTDPVTGMDIYTEPATPNTSYIDFEIALYDADDDPITDASNEIWLYPSGGGRLVGPRNRDLASGTVTIRYWIPAATVTLTLAVKCIDTTGETPIVDGSLSILIEGYET